MEKKKVVIALGHRALGNTLPEQKEATKKTAKIIARLVKEGAEIVISHSNAPQVGMIHTAMNEFGKYHPDYTFAPMSVCSAMSQGYIGYDLQNAIRSELMKDGIYKPVCTVLTQVIVDPYDEAFAEPVKIIGRILNAQEAEEEGFTEIAAKMRGVAEVERHHEERYMKLLKNIEEGIVFSREGDTIWKCRNCGHIVVGKKAPEICPVCAHPQSYFEISAQNF